MVARLLATIEWLLTWTISLIVHSIVYVLTRLRAVWDWVTFRACCIGNALILCLYCLATRRRVLNENGVAARGWIRVLDNTEVPANEFFTPGKLDFCRCRFSSLAFSDDARLIGRGAELKFRDARHASPLDLMMATGVASPFTTVRQYWGFLWMRILGRGPAAIRFMQADPARYVACHSGLRRNPKTFAKLRYRTTQPVVMRFANHTHRYVKFRLVPWEGGKETGLLKGEDLLDWAWCKFGVRPGESLAPNYLKRELARRIEKKPLRFRLQMQSIPVQEHDRPDIVDATIEWSEASAPFLDLAEVQLEQMLDRDEEVRMTFSQRNVPACMEYRLGNHVDHPAGINNINALGIWPDRVRRFAIALLGPCKLPSDARDWTKTPLSPYAEPIALGDREALLLPQHERTADRAVRRYELYAAATEYPIATPGDMPSHIERLPDHEQFDKTHQTLMYSDITSTIADLGLAGITRVDRNDRTLKTFLSYYPLRQLPAVHNRWRSDEEFGRQRLNGVNPTLIKKCTAIPSNFLVTDALVQNLLPPDTTLSQEIEAGRVFLTDHAVLDGLPTHDNAYLTAPLSLFHVSHDGGLLPIAIQLSQQTTILVRGQEIPTPVFTPLDPPWLWLVVKTHVQCADAAYHEVCGHLMRTHMISESVYVCARRTLSVRHPLMELLDPHFRDTLAINDAARTDMLAPRGPLPRTMAAGYQGTIELLKRTFAVYSFEEVNIRIDMERRGLLDTDESGQYVLRHFHYRDDGLRVHAAIETWVRTILTMFYTSDTDVQEDDELQAFAFALSDEDQGNVKGMPFGGKLQKIDEVIHVVTQIIYNASAEHSAVNNGQYDYFGFMPNTPGAMSLPPPTSHDELSETHLVEALPGPVQSSVQIAMVHLLSKPCEWPLGHYPYGFFQGHPGVAAATKRFRSRLDYLSFDIRSRNALLDVPYPYLDPRLIGKSTLI